MRIDKTRLLYLLMAVAVTGFLACCDDCPNCPGDNPPEVMDYRLYSFDPMSSFIMSMDIPADTIIDSISVDYHGANIFVTPDGGKLLVMRFNYEEGHKIEVYNTSDLSHDQTLDLYGLYFFDGGDNYGICLAFDSVCFINPLVFTKEQTALLPFSTYTAYLDTVTNRFFVGTRNPADSTRIVYIFDCLTRELTDSLVFPWSFGNIADFAYNWLTDDLYMETRVNTGVGYLRIYNLETDSLISSYYLSEVGGSVAVSPDGNEVYVTDGGNGMLGYVPQRPLWIFDAHSRRLETWIPPYDSAGLIPPYFGRICFTPDGNRAYIGTAGSSSAPVPIIAVDTRTREIIHRVSPFPTFLAIIASGPVPQTETEKRNLK